jgi:hypothetical protein
MSIILLGTALGAAELPGGHGFSFQLTGYIYCRQAFGLAHTAKLSPI